MTEQIVGIGTAHSMVGILARPGIGAEDDLPGVVFVNTGLIHRVGGQRMAVTLARRLAAAGLPTLRMDFSGIGDSRAARSASNGADPLGELMPGAAGVTRVYGRWVQETREALDFMEATTGRSRFVLIGHCSGAAVSFLSALADPRVVGLVLVNAQGPFELRQILRTVLVHRSSWRRLISGRLKIRWVLRRLLHRSKSGKEPQLGRDIAADLEHLARRGVDVLMVQSEWDVAYSYFRRLFRARLSTGAARDRLRLETLPGADHELTLGGHQGRYFAMVEAWIARLRAERWTCDGSRRNSVRDLPTAAS